MLCSPILPNPQDSHPPCRLERVDTDVSSSTDISSPAPPDASSPLSAVALALLLPPAVLAFSLHFPFVLPYVSSAALSTYIPASYRYDDVRTRFDNTAWTYGTDYVLAAVMGAIARFLLTSGAGRSSKRLRYYSAALLACYAMSTLAGGYAHQTVVGVEMLNTVRFRALWIVCVGNVSFASCWMGMIGREVARLFGSSPVPLGPWYLWPVYGTFMTAACAMGYMSFKRPACDIFIAGITQFPTTFYCLVALMAGVRNNRLRKSAGVGDNDSVGQVDKESKKSHPMDHVLLRYVIMYCVGFIGNAPLLPMYPMLVQYSGMSLAGINTLLHAWLMVMWGMQGISLLHLCRVIDDWEKAELVDGKKE